MIKEVFKAHVAAYVLFEVGKSFVLFTLAVVPSYIGAGILSSTVNELTPYKWPLFALFLACLILVIYFIYQKIKKNRPDFPRLETDFHVIERNLCYEYLSVEQMIYKRRVILRASRNGLNCYQDKFRWTGEGKVKLRSEIPEHEVVLTSRKSVWQLFEVRFPKTLREGEEIEVEVVWELEDSGRKAVPFFSITIEEPTDRLRMELRLNSSLKVARVVCEHSPNIGAKLPFESKEKAVDRGGCALWEIPHPKLLHHYEMRWVMPI